MDPKLVATSVRQLRAATIALLDRLDDAQLDTEAVPRWSVADVFRHLAASDRDSVLLKRVWDVLAWTTPEALEAGNDVALERLRRHDRHVLRDELERWGRRLAAIIGSAPRALASVRVPTLFGTAPAWWIGALRPYDEWVHQRDVHAAIGEDDPAMPHETRVVVGRMLLLALPIGPLRQVHDGSGVVAIDLDDLPERPWRFDFIARRSGPQVTDQPSATLVTDVPTFALVAADRLAWRDAEAAGLIRVDGDDRATAERLLDAVRVV